MTSLPDVHGSTAPGFEPVRHAFAANFGREEPNREAGAALCVYVRGRCVVDLWGGVAAPGRAWEADTLVNVWSVTKGVVAAAVAMLVDRGEADYDAPVARYWPEFAQAGKGGITLEQMMSHQAGLNGFDAPTSLEDFFDWDLVTGRLAAQAPAWTPGTLASYHAMTYGFLAGEVIRRVSGRTPGAFIRDEISGPLGADIFVGLPEVLEGRVAPVLPPPLEQANADANADPRSGVAGRATVNPRVDPAWPNRRDWRAAEVPAANGHASARGLGRFYGALAHGGEMDGTRLLSTAGVERMRRTRHSGPDQMLGPRHWGAGVASHVTANFGPDPETFGHTGWGGAFGCANAGREAGVGYVMSRMGTQITGNPRGGSLCDALFASLPNARPATRRTA